MNIISNKTVVRVLIVITNMKTFIGIDNGVSGSIGIINEQGSEFFPVPCFTEQSYTKAKQNISRVDHKELRAIFAELIGKDCMIIIERPMVNPGRFKATASALRALESVLVIVEQFNLPYQYIDSKEWQKELLPKGSKGNELKVHSKQIGKRLFPQFSGLIDKHKDADGLLIAEHCRRKFK